MASDFEKLQDGFRRSWMNEATCVTFLDAERERRQNALVLDAPDASPDTEGWRDDQGPYAFTDLVAIARRGLADVAAVFTVTFGCALIAELLASVFNESRRAGGAFEESQHRQRGKMQDGLVTLRNAVCHPGYLAAPVNDFSNVDALALLLPAEQHALSAELLRDRRAIQRAGVARWATARVDSLGRFEAGGAIVDQLERRGISVSLQDRIDIDKRAKDTRGLPRCSARSTKRRPAPPTCSSAVTGRLLEHSEGAKAWAGCRYIAFELYAN